MSKQTKHLCHMKDNAIKNFINTLVIFGCYYSDIHIGDNCNTQASSYSYFGDNYTLPNGIVKDSNEAHSYLAGAFQFKVEEIEVYSVKFF